MDKQNEIIANLMRKAEQLFGFLFACQLHNALKHNEPGSHELLRKVLKA